MTIRIGGGPSSSANYTTFAGIGNLITQDHPDYLINTEISTGSQENIRMIQSGTVQFGVAMTDVEEAAFNGTREFEGSPVEICHVMGGYTTMLHMFVPKDSDVNSIGDLKGKKLAVSKGAMAQYYMPILLEAYGLTKDDRADNRDRAPGHLRRGERRERGFRSPYHPLYQLPHRGFGGDQGYQAAVHRRGAH